jgi:hypothetical protein
MNSEQIIEARRLLCLLMGELGTISEALTSAEIPAQPGDAKDCADVAEQFSDARDACMQIELSAGQLWDRFNSAAALAERS